MLISALSLFFILLLYPLLYPVELFWLVHFSSCRCQFTAWPGTMVVI